MMIPDMLPTVSDNILAKVTASEDDEEMSTLLTLFESTNPSLLPCTEILDFVLTPTEDEHLWLAINLHTATFDAAFSLLSEATPGCLPTYPVYVALDHAIDWADETEDDDDAVNFSVQWTTALALLVRSDADPIDEDILTRMKAHHQWQCRASAIDILADMKRVDEIISFLTDSNDDVACTALFVLPVNQKSLDALNNLLATQTLSEWVAKMARQSRDSIHASLAQMVSIPQR